MNTIQVTTPCGVVEGFQEDGVNCFLGIPYATAKRFEYPQPVISWKGICDAKKYGPAPIQQRAYVQVDASDPQNHYEHEFYQNFQSEYSEDCLNLNIWTPDVVFRENEKFAFEMTKSADKYLQGIKTENGI